MHLGEVRDSAKLMKIWESVDCNGLVAVGIDDVKMTNEEWCGLCLSKKKESGSWLLNKTW